MIEKIFIERAGKAGLEISMEAAEKFAAYRQMVIEANRSMNLTRVSEDPEEAVDRDALDALAPLRIPGLMPPVRTLIDVGSGAGVPGVVLAICLPHVKVTLLDATKKRVDFLNRVCEALQLSANAVHMRSEDAARDTALRDSFDCATARAVASLPALLELSLPFVRPGGFFLAYKGPALEDELPAAKSALFLLGGKARAPLFLPIPGRDWDHRLLIVDKLKATPAAYPRKAGEPEKKPL
jgi:16S rRNA (guanine527-N7)-methyltransferase